MRSLSSLQNIFFFIFLSLSLSLLTSSNKIRPDLCLCFCFFCLFDTTITTITATAINTVCESTFISSHRVHQLFELLSSVVFMNAVCWQLKVCVFMCDRQKQNKFYSKSAVFILMTAYGTNTYTNINIRLRTNTCTYIQQSNTTTPSS